MKICFIGGGNMASALIGGLLAKGYARDSIAVVEPDAEARARLQQTFGVACHDHCDSDSRAATATAQVIILAVKPQNVPEAAATLGTLRAEQLVISIAAGVRLADISSWLHGHRVLVRSMPNMPALIGEGIAGLYALPGVGVEDRRKAGAIMAAVGEFIWLEDETMMDAITAVSGSGPAYVFYFIEALEKSAAKLGFSKADATKLAIATFRGAALLAAQSTESATALRDRVTSKGGTTAAAIAVLEAAGVGNAIAHAVAAAMRRGQEMGNEPGRASGTGSVSDK